MNNPNISAELPEQVKEQIKTDIRNIVSKLPFLVNLDSKAKQNLVKMGKGSVAFVEEALTISKNHPDILPVNFNVAEFEKDVKLTAALSDIASVLTPLSEGISDTLTAVGSEAINQANLIYAHVKLASKNDVNMDEIKNRLGARYKNKGKSKAKAKTN
jgi:hypothetical protein